MPNRTIQAKDRDNQLSPYRRWQNDAKMALAATRDYPNATAGLILTVGVLAFAVGYLMRSHITNTETEN